ncbi:hypothetical protein [Phaeovulum sp.]|uniref:hypothetical protein n=1 Tax=Phaeovulum sp. TaxID=2934796 RepID=UPI0039E31C4C
MKSPVIAALTLSLVLAGCGISDSRLNPFNWFGKSTEQASTLEPADGYAKSPNDYRIPVAQITSLEIKPVQGGAVITAVGLPQTQGWWDAELIAGNGGLPENGVLGFTFVVAAPLPGTAAASRTSTSQSREVSVATFIGNQKLAGVTRITVTAAGNARTISR